MRCNAEKEGVEGTCMPMDYGYNVVAFRTAFIVGVEISRLNGELRNCALSLSLSLSLLPVSSLVDIYREKF